MKPKPFWPLNHLTVPVAISLLQGAKPAPMPARLRTGLLFNLSDVLGKGPCGAISKARPTNRMRSHARFCDQTQANSRGTWPQLRIRTIRSRIAVNSDESSQLRGWHEIALRRPHLHWPTRPTARGSGWDGGVGRDESTTMKCSHL